MMMSYIILRKLFKVRYRVMSVWMALNDLNKLRVDAYLFKRTEKNLTVFKKIGIPVDKALLNMTRYSIQHFC